MIHYHGGPITPVKAAIKAWQRRHAMISFAHPEQIEVAAEVCQSFAIDNGAFSMWKAGVKIDWEKYYDFLDIWVRHPGCDFAIIPDVIEGSERDNDALIDRWFFKWSYFHAAPVWHLHESLDRLKSLLRFQRIALGSSGEYAQVGTVDWWRRMEQAMEVVCDEKGFPKVKLHGLRMLNPMVFSRLPLASADSTNVARNIGIDKAWTGAYQPASKTTRAEILMERIELHASANRWNRQSTVFINEELVG